MAAGLAPRSVARSVACVRGFYRFVALERKQRRSPGRRSSPAARVAGAAEVSVARGRRSAARAARIPSTPRGLRDKALIEVLYATGLRVSELVSLRAGDLNLEEGYLTCIGKGDKQRMVPLGQQAVTWVRRYLAEGRAALLRKEALAVAVRQRARRRRRCPGSASGSS